MECGNRNILIYSPDANVYNIGLSFINQRPTATFLVQLNLTHSDESKCINLTSFYMSLLQDMDLSNVRQDMYDTAVVIDLQWV